MLLKSVLSLLLVTVVSVSSQVAITDATAGFVKSTESEYDHEVTLIEGELTFHWNDANGNTVDCRLIHNAGSLTDAPSWLSIGFYDTFSNTGSVSSSIPFMIGSDAVIGLVANSNVQKYGLGGKAVSETNGVHPLEHQTLTDATIKQHDSDDGTVRTLLTFTKELEESNVEEVRLRHSGQNVFLWAVGAAGETALGLHKKKGALTLDLAVVEARAEQGESGTDTDDGAITSDASKNTANIVDGSCTSELDEYDKQFAVQSNPPMSFHWKIEGDILKGALQYESEAWLGFGVSSDGKMTGSEAIIGKPDEGTTTKYLLSDKTKAGIEAVKDTTSLKTATIVQDSGVTTLQFENTLDVSGDTHTISSTGLNTFIYAAGKDNLFGYHGHSGSFRIDLASCEGREYTKSHMGAFAAHGTIATLAWAIASPFAVTVAWFRTLVPSSWIYIHVFSNVMTFFFTLIAVIVAISAMSVQTDSSHFNHPHHWVGLVLLVGVTFQVMNGFLRPPVEKRDPYSASHYDMDNGWLKLPRSPREVWYFSHRVTGISMLLMGIYQIQSGLSLFANNYNVTSIAPWFWAYVGIFAFCLISLKFWIMYEEYKARRGMEAMHVEHRSGGSSTGGASEDLVPVQFDMS